MLRVLALLGPRFPQLRVTFYGDGPMRAELEELSSSLGVQDRATFAGKIRHAALPAALADKHALVLPTYMPGETFPLCLLEGASLGLPAIASRWFGIPDIIEDGLTGWLVEPQSVVSLTSACERLLLDPQRVRAAGERAQARALSRFTATAVCAAYRALYDGAPAQDA